MSFGHAYTNRRVLVTGHTGFKGSWLCEWLLSLSAQVTGYALAPNTNPALFDQLQLAGRMNHQLGDVRDLGAVRQVVETFQPEIIFHLAAQPLVRLSYEQPVETYSTNVMGTAHVLEAVRLSKRPCVVVLITTDKCYENREWVHSYREEDPMGGYDPYSSSKGAAELVIAAYRRSFFSDPSSLVRIASARSGNVIGGGDWSLDRIVPDAIRALQRNEAIPVRNKVARRPWQHVLEPLSGYLWLGACLLDPRLIQTSSSPLTSAFNFGPGLNSNRTVLELVQELLTHWPGRLEDKTDPQAVHEATLLNLAVDKAFHQLHWSPVWDFKQTLQHTVSWYQRAQSPNVDVADLTRRQIALYAAMAQSQGLPWGSHDDATTQREKMG